MKSNRLRNGIPMGVIAALSFSFSVFSGAAPSPDKEDLTKFLELFGSNSAEAMNRSLVKRNVPGFADRKGKADDEIEAFSNRNFIKTKDDARKTFSKKVIAEDGSVQLITLESTLPGRAPFRENDLAEDVVDLDPKDLVRSLTEMENQNLKETELQGEQIPWSDDYWPIYRGILGARYAIDNPFGTAFRFKDWSTYFSYIEENPMDKILNSAQSLNAIDLLSPSEKYDLLIGANQFALQNGEEELKNLRGALTTSMWQQPLNYFKEDGKVETWMGICHGWAPASYVFPRPVKPVVVQSPDGKKIRFYPSDIKALGSLLWAETRTPTKFIGGRCYDKNPKKDRNGRTLSQNCFDTNPGTWHLAVVNQLGKAKRSLIMDATYDYEVWNQPIVSYSYTYFNPQTLKEADSLEKARVPFDRFTKDKFGKYRTDRNGKLRRLLIRLGLLPKGWKGALVDSVVGVSMAVTYIVETMPSHSETDAPEYDGRKTVEYRYDLELNKKGEIIGGEWYTNLHPDFLWTPEPMELPITEGDEELDGKWNGKGKVPPQWQEVATRTAKHSQPLAKIIRALFKQGSSEN